MAQDHLTDAPTRGGCGIQISNEIVGLFRTHGGKGPTKYKTYFDDDLVLVLLRGGFTAADQTMFEAGKWLNVREAKQTFQDSIQVQLTEVIERVTGRTVIAFMSASHQQPDLMIEAFLINEPLSFRPVEHDGDREENMAGFEVEMDREETSERRRDSATRERKSRRP